MIFLDSLGILVIGLSLDFYSVLESSINYLSESLHAGSIIGALMLFLQNPFLLGKLQLSQHLPVPVLKMSHEN